MKVKLRSVGKLYFMHFFGHAQVALLTFLLTEINKTLNTNRNQP